MERKSRDEHIDAAADQGSLSGSGAGGDGRPPDHSETARDLPAWKAALLSLAAVALFFALLEGVLAIAGVGAPSADEDPFVGFAGNRPLFVEDRDAAGAVIRRTADDKQFFNRQSFVAQKPAGTYRIFCLGGSTTFGRPFDDKTSFAGWLRELLPLADPNRDWEVINAGGVSYASYRVALLMRELARYEPDLFVVYTGHNEFLEKRSYGTFQGAPGFVRNLAALLARTRTWAAMQWLLGRVGLVPAGRGGDRPQLGAEVDTMLEHYGPEIYERDDALAQGVLRHFRDSLERMVRIAEEAGAELLFVQPAANLKDCSPFKSEHTDGLGDAERVRAEELAGEARAALRDGRWEDALAALDEAVALDPRYAAHHFERGRTLLALDRPEEAAVAFVRARDEDVCPLRALTSMRGILVQVAETTGQPLVDFPAIVAARTRERAGVAIPGDELFLDHVHPTVEGNGRLAERIVDELIQRGIVRPTGVRGEEAFEVARSRTEGRLGESERAHALTKLAQVLAWSGKVEEASRSARQALDTGVTEPLVVSPAASILATWFAQEGDVEREWEYRRLALRASPKNADLHFRTGLRILDLPTPELERAAAHVFFATVFWPGEQLDEIHRTLGRVLAERGDYAAALSHFLEARRLAPRHPENGALIARTESRLGPAAAGVTTPKITLEEYPSGALRKIIQVKLDPAGNAMADGVWTEWYETGMPARFLVNRNGAPTGPAVTWDPDGRVFASPR